MKKVQLQKIMFYPPSKGYALLLREEQGERQLPIIVGAFEAQAIALALERIDMPRPITHDLLANMMRDLHVKIHKITVSDLIEGTFYAKILAERIDNSDVIEIDSRPSDAIALALRMDAPIFVADKVMDEAGRIFTEVESEKVRAADESFPEIDELDYLFRLKNRLQEAIDRENYEEAAKLRDEIKAIEKDSPTN
jgi:bifunctional DNase/RNase